MDKIDGLRECLFYQTRKKQPINGLLGDHVLIAPPLIITAEEVSELLKRLDRSLSRLMNTIKASV